MPKQEGQKSKLLTLLRILEQKTDEEHLLNVPQLVELLEQQDILAERKSIYSDIDTLRSLGYDIQLRRGRGGAGALLCLRNGGRARPPLPAVVFQGKNAVRAKACRCQAACQEHTDDSSHGWWFLLFYSVPPIIAQHFGNWNKHFFHSKQNTVQKL